MNSVIKIRSIIILTCFILNCFSVFAQFNTDSIRYYLHHTDMDVRVEKVTLLAWELNPPNPDTSLFYALAVNKFINKEVSQINVAFNYHIIGTIYSNLSDYESALLWLEKAYTIKKKLKDKNDLLITVNNIIYAWQGLGDIKKTHQYVLEAEKLCETMTESNSLNYIVSLTQLADIYSSLKREDKAEEYFLKAIGTAERNKDIRQLNISYQNYGSYLITHMQYQKALKYIEKGLTFQKQLNEPDKYRTARVNLAIIYAESGRKDEALAIFKEVYDQTLTGTDFYEKSSSSNNLGYFYFVENKYNMALPLFIQSLGFANEAKAFKLIMDRYQIISETYEQLKDYKASLKYSRLYQKLNDSLFNVETVKQINSLNEKYGNEKKEKKILELKKNNAEIKLKEEETKRVSQRNNIVFGSLIILVLIISLFIYYSLLQKKKANLSLTAKNQQINHQHKQLEEKQKEILDSIHYAKRIQDSLLPTEKYFEKKITELKKKS